MKFNNIAKLVVSLEFKERSFLILFIAITIPIAIDALARLWMPLPCH
jgi:hypothetical protein